MDKKKKQNEEVPFDENAMAKLIWVFAGSSLLLGGMFGFMYSFRKFGGSNKVSLGFVDDHESLA